MDTIRRHARLLNLLALAAGVAMISLIAGRIGWACVIDELRGVGWRFGWVLLAAAGVVLCDARALGIATRRPLRQVIGPSLAGASVNAFTPFSEAGEVVKWNLLRTAGGGADTASAVLCWNLLFRLVKYAAVFLAPPLSYLVDPHRFSTRTLLGVEVAAALAFVPTLVLLVVAWRGSAQMMTRLLSRVGLLRDPERWLEKAKRMNGSLRTFSGARRRDAAAMACWLSASRLLSALEVLLALHFVGFAVDYASALFLHCAAMVLCAYLGVLPIPLGMQETGQYALYGLVGLSPAAGFTQALLLRVQALTFNAIGFLYLLRAGVRARSAARARRALVTG